MNCFSSCWVIIWDHSLRLKCYILIFSVLLEFRNHNARNPEISTKDEDIEKLKIIKKSIVDLYNVNENVFHDSLFDQVFGEVVPVCAILGGVIAQEVIKAVSHKEITINNVFLLDPLTFNGKEECVGA